MKLEYRDEPMENRYKKKKQTNKIRMLSDTFVFDNVNKLCVKYTMTTRSKTSMFEWYNL